MKQWNIMSVKNIGILDFEAGGTSSYMYSRSVVWNIAVGLFTYSYII
jgi:hypothetical protein